MVIQISERLRTAAGLIGEGERLADVGTDHGYVPIYLVERKTHPVSAIAMDIRTGPLERAREHIRMYGHGRLHTDSSVGRRCGA